MIAWLDSQDPFPPIDRALGPGSGASGLLAASAGLSPQRLLTAYRQGIFPWYEQGRPVLWWSPDPRMVLRPDDFRVSTTFRKTLRRVLDAPSWEIRVDHAFREVMVACATTARPGQPGTWITEEMVHAYTDLHHRGYAHSVESWHAGQRVGGLYGVAIGRMFYGESMFTYRPDASKIALAALCAFLGRHDLALIDCQQETEHLTSLGGVLAPRAMFLAQVREAVSASVIVPWRFDKSVLCRWTARHEQA